MFSSLKSTKKISLFILALCSFCFVIGPVFAEFMGPTLAPVARLIINLTAFTKENPKEANGYYVLARVHSLAYFLKTNQLAVYNDLKKPKQRYEIDHFLGYKGYGTKLPASKTPKPKELRTHLKESIKNFQKAIKLDAKVSYFYLGLAYTLEQGAKEATGIPPGLKISGLEEDKPGASENIKKIKKILLMLRVNKTKRTPEQTLKIFKELVNLAKKEGVKALPFLEKFLNHSDKIIRGLVAKLFKPYWIEQARVYYLKAFELAIKKDSKQKFLPMHGLQVLTSHEAGKAYLRLMKDKVLGKEEKEKVKTVTEAMDKFKKLRPGAITPIIFSLKKPFALDKLIKKNEGVQFDLDGDRIVEKWSWVKPDTGILVWDPKGLGQINSGRQLFGSVTFWMFWKNGYQALDALDDNRDGELSGAELKGLAVWQDKNSNGVSDPGEVKSLEKSGIESLKVKATTQLGETPANLEGLRLRDGTVLPTYDWIAKRMDNE